MPRLLKLRSCCRLALCFSATFQPGLTGKEPLPRVSGCTMILTLLCFSKSINSSVVLPLPGGIGNPFFFLFFAIIHSFLKIRARLVDSPPALVFEYLFVSAYLIGPLPGMPAAPSPIIVGSLVSQRHGLYLHPSHSE